MTPTLIAARPDAPELHELLTLLDDEPGPPRVAPRVLHVDGDPDAALVLTMLLVPETEVTHVATLGEALQTLRQHAYALVVLDPDLPDGDGASLLAALQAAGLTTPVLLYSARQPQPAQQAAAFLPKPWTSPRQLWRTVADLLGLPNPGSGLPIAQKMPG
ncbi:MAG: response regulator [Sphingomonadaceae bacterium]